MTRRTRTLLLILGIVTLAAAAWITVNIQNGSLSSRDDTVDVELIAPAA